MPIRQGFAPGTAASTRSAMSIFAPINKGKGDGDSGVSGTGDLQDELTLSMKDDELISLSDKWEADYRKYEGDIKKKQDKNVNYWLGKHKGFDSSSYNTTDNVLFESLETFLPLITQKSPSPLVMADNTPEGIQVSMTVQKMLQFVADKEKLKTKLKSVLRNWALYYVGTVKMGYDFLEEEISLTVVRPPEMIFDPSGLNRFRGEKKSATAQRLTSLFPKKEKVIKEMVGGKMGTKMDYVEWWTKDYLFWRLGTEILLKHKNPHWNYTTTEEVVNELGETETKETPGTNHFKAPKMPFIDLNVFSLGKQPHDETSVVEQAIPLQDSVNKLNRQIDKGLDDMNNGWIVSSLFTKDQAKSLADAIRRGGVAQAPTPNIDQSIKRVQATPLPGFVTEQLSDKRSEISNVIGVRGSTAQGLNNVRTVRGIQALQQMDTQRVGLITEYVEQFVDDIFNWMVQLMHVYYTQDHVASLIGNEKAVDFITLSNKDLDRQLIITVQEGSMIPQDPMSRRNTAIDLWNAKAIDPITLYERLDDPTPRETAQKLYTWMTNPGALFGEQAPQPAAPDPNSPPGLEPAAPQPTPSPVQPQAGNQPENPPAPNPEMPPMEVKL